MKNRVWLIIGMLGVFVIAMIIFGIIKLNNKPATGIEDNSKPTVSEISLNTKQYINQLEKIKIKGTNDSIMITKKVKWEVPEHEPGTTVSFSIAIPYTIIVDGSEYNGIYELNNTAMNKSDNNPKYNLTITNLTEEGDLEILIENKK